MRTIKKVLISLTLVILLLASNVVICSVSAVSTSSTQKYSYTIKDGKLIKKYENLINAESGYIGIVVDDADLLTDEEEKELLAYIQPLTNYSNIAVYTVATKTSMNVYDRTREKRKELFGMENAAVFTIDMYHRMTIIHRMGNMEKIFNNAKANAITDEVAIKLKKQYYKSACITALTQMRAVIENNIVPTRMKNLSNICVSISLGLLISFIIAMKLSTTYSSKNKNKIENIKISYISKELVSTTTRKIESSSGGGSRCGSSCSSCGSSCSSCSSCGSSCGGSSF